MAVKMEDLQKRLLDTVADGFGIYAIEKAVEYLRSFSKKYLKQHNDAVVKISLSLVDLVVPQVRNVPYVGDWLNLIGKTGVRDIAKLYIDKVTDCWAEDANTIICINFDTTEVSVKIDGASVTPAISGSPEEFTMSLTTPLTAGAHDLVVVGKVKAFAGKIYV